MTKILTDPFGFYERLFTSEDVDNLAVVTNCKLVDGANAEVLAAALTQAFCTCIHLATNQDRHTKSKTLRKSRRILQLSSQLLIELGYDPAEDLFSTAPKTISDRAELPDDHSSLCFHLVSSDPEDPQRKYVELELLIDVTRSIEAVRGAARAALTFDEMRFRIAKAHEKKGMTKNKSRELLFAYLASIFYASYAMPPNLNGDRASDEDTPVIWIKEVCRLALSRKNNQEPELQAVIDGISGIKATATFANYVRAGWLEWESWTLAEQKWPTHFWDPAGTTIIRPVIPQWVADPRLQKCGYGPGMVSALRNSKP